MRRKQAFMAPWILLISLVLFFPALGLCEESASEENVPSASEPQLGAQTEQAAPGMTDSIQGLQGSGPTDDDSESEANPTDPLVEAMLVRWTGDLDGMLRDRVIRALVVQSKTMYDVAYKLVQEETRQRREAKDTMR